MQVKYGVESLYVDVTDRFGKSPSVLYVPEGDQDRSKLFGGDPLAGILKHVLIVDSFGVSRIYAADTAAKLTADADGKFDNSKAELSSKFDRLRTIHSSLTLRHGSLNDEVPEQLMALKFVYPSSKVLEIGGNIGRNSCVIGRILTDSSNLVVLESSPAIAVQLAENKRLNDLSFHVEASALSKRPLIQRSWDTVPYDPSTEAVPAGWSPVPTITWSELRAKYPLDFDTLVADCEGALYYILKDEPEFLCAFNSVIMENDYHEIEHKRAVDLELAKHGFHCVHREGGGWGPCAGFFFETWRKTDE